MRKRDVRVGAVYVVKVSEREVPVEIRREALYGKGWIGRNLTTGREVRIRSAQRLRREVTAQR